jgi:hypothetical protein
LEKYDLSLGMDVDGIFNKIEKAKNKTNVMKKD